jgi:hypothetical protein
MSGKHDFPEAFWSNISAEGKFFFFLFSPQVKKSN